MQDVEVTNEPYALAVGQARRCPRVTTNCTATVGGSQKKEAAAREPRSRRSLRPGGLSVYSSDRFEIRIVARAIDSKYALDAGAASRLSFQQWISNPRIRTS